MKKPKAKTDHQRLAVYLPAEAIAKIDDLSEARNIESRSAIISQAVALWHHDDPLVKTMLAKREALKEKA